MKMTQVVDNTTVTLQNQMIQFSISNTSLLNVTVPNSLLTNVSAVNVSQSGVEYPTEFSISATRLITQRKLVSLYFKDLMVE